MSYTTGPWTITGGQTIRITVPSTDIVAKAVAVGNLTPAAVEVTVAGTSKYVLPGSADLVLLTSQSTIQVTSLGTSTPTTQGGKITTTWFTPAQIPTSGPYPYGSPVTDVNIRTATLDIGSVTTIKVVETINAGNVTAGVINQTGTILQTGNYQKLLYSVRLSSFTIGPVTVTIPATTVPQTLGALVVNCDVGKMVCAEAISGSTLLSHPRTVAPAGKLGTGLSTGTATVPGAFDAKTEITLTLYMSTAGGGGTGGDTLYVWGLTQNPGVQPRSDGRAYPIGSKRFSNFWTATAAQTLIAAPTSPLRIFIKEATFAAGTGALLTVTSGTTTIAYGGFSAPEKITNELLAPGKSLGASINTSKPTFAFGTYDLVV